MSATPRTAAATNGRWVYATFAEGLERELNELRARNEAMARRWEEKADRLDRGGRFAPEPLAAQCLRDCAAELLGDWSEPDGSGKPADPSGSLPIVDSEEVAWEWFCGAHPHEAHAKDPERFWEHFKKMRPGVPREVMVRLLMETESPDRRDQLGGEP